VVAEAPEQVLGSPRDPAGVLGDDPGRLGAYQQVQLRGLGLRDLLELVDRIVVEVDPVDDPLVQSIEQATRLIGGEDQRPGGQVLGSRFVALLTAAGRERPGGCGDAVVVDRLI
jgi:hypothetical protein